MNANAARRLSGVNGYVHKLRLEASDGAHVVITAPIGTHQRRGGWIFAKFIALAVTTTSLLLLAASRL